MWEISTLLGYCCILFLLADQLSIAQLAMATLGSVAGLTILSTGGSKAKAAQGPPINAQSPDEEKFIKYVSCSINPFARELRLQVANTPCREFMANAEAEEKKSHGNNADMSKKDAGR